jgi:hypothetical protein
LNLAGGNYWLVLVNQAGNWVGQIMGGPEGTNIAGSPIFQFIVNPITGAITAVNEGNGADSNNTATATSTTNNTVNQSNTANINNTLNLSANTGGNETNYNTGGNSSITTGDANIVANIVNFVNNNIVGDGTLIVTVINVFGSWFGDFIGPGQSKQSTNTQTAQGGGTGGEANVTSQGSNNNSNSSSNDSAGGTTTTSVASTNASGNVTVAGGNGSVLGTFSGIPFANLFAGASNNTKPSVIVDSSKALTINLAWAVLILPFAMLYIIKRKFASIRDIVAKGVHLLL